MAENCRKKTKTSKGTKNMRLNFRAKYLHEQDERQLTRRTLVGGKRKYFRGIGVSDFIFGCSAKIDWLHFNAKDAAGSIKQFGLKGQQPSGPSHTISERN